MLRAHTSLFSTTFAIQCPQAGRAESFRIGLLFLRLNLTVQHHQLCSDSISGHIRAQRPHPSQLPQAPLLFMELFGKVSQNGLITSGFISWEENPLEGKVTQNKQVIQLPWQLFMTSPFFW